MNKKNDKPIKERENKALWLRKLIPSYRHRDYSYHYQVFTLFEIITKSLTKRLEEVRMKHGYEKGLEPKLQTDSIKILKFNQNLKIPVLIIMSYILLMLMHLIQIRLPIWTWQLTTREITIVWSTIFRFNFFFNFNLWAQFPSFRC